MGTGFGEQGLELARVLHLPVLHVGPEWHVAALWNLMSFYLLPESIAQQFDIDSHSQKWRTIANGAIRNEYLPYQHNVER